MKKALSFVLPLAVFAILFDYQRQILTTIFYAFQARDLDRALELSHGQPIFFGPEMTGGGNLPGPFYYLLLSLSQIWQPGWHSAWWLMVGLAGLTCVAAAWFLRSVDLADSGFFWVLVFGLSVQTMHFMNLFINPSYAFLTVTLLLICAVVAFGGQDSRFRGRAFVAAGVLAGLSIQLHFSGGFLWLAMIFMQVCAKRLRLERVSWRAFVTGLAGFGLTLTPYLGYLVASRLGVSTGQQASLGREIDVWPTFSYLVAEIANLDPGVVAVAAGQHLLRVLPLPLLVAFVSLCWGRPSGSDSGRRLIRPLLVCAAFSFIPFSYVFVVPIANRYGMPLFLSALFIFVVLEAEWLGESRLRKRFNTVALAVVLGLGTYLVLGRVKIVTDELYGWGGHVALALGLALACLAKVTPARAATLGLTVLLAVGQNLLARGGELTSSGNNMVNFRQWRTVWTRIMSFGNWTFEDVKHRIYFVNLHIDGDPGLAYSAVKDRLRIAPRENRPGSPEGDGFIVAFDFDPRMDLKDWLLQQPIMAELKDAIRSGQIEFEHVVTGRILTARYRVVNTDLIPRPFHNWALYYRKPSDESVLSVTGEGVRETDEGYLFHWNECPDGKRVCQTGALVALEPHSGGALIRTRVTGPVLSQVSPWIHQTWTQAWNRPYVEIKCGSKWIRREMATSIGYNREYMVYDQGSHYFVANNSFVAPFERTFEVTCPGPITDVAVGRESSSVDSLRKTMRLPGRRLATRVRVGTRASRLF